MAERAIRILQVSTADIDGGAERVAKNLFQGCKQRGYSAWLAVGKQVNSSSDALKIPNDSYRGSWTHQWMNISNLLSPLVGRVRGVGRVRNVLSQVIGQPQRWLEVWRGHEDFDYPGSWHLLDLPPQRPNILHCHNLHGGYFDLRALPELSLQVPVVLTLHDAWMLSGHCAHSFGCERWKTGCGECPDLTILPSLPRDGTAYNWERKQQVYLNSRLYVSTPCQWLMERVEQSILQSAIVEARVIPYGIDLFIFKPADKREVRSSLGLPQDAKIVLFTANKIKKNPFKDYQTMRAAVALVGEKLRDQEILFLALGEDGPTERIGGAEVRFVSFKNDPEAVSHYYQAADVYVHAAHEDTFPNTILEALACGTPVVATAVGGIPEQVRGLREIGRMGSKLNFFDVSEATGFLVPEGDAEAMAVCIEGLLQDESLLHLLSENAAKDAKERFDLRRQVDDYLAWYQQILSGSKEQEIIRETIPAS